MKKEDWNAVLFVCSICMALFISCLLSAYLTLAFFFGACVGAIVGIESFLGHLRRFRVKTLGGWLYSAERLEEEEKRK